MLLPRILLCLGVAAGTLSIWDTLSHTWNPSYQAPALALGPSHTNYHAFREFMLSVGAVLVELYGVFQPAAKRTRPLWVAMCLTAVFYYGGWWLPWPLFGLRTPNLVATVDHLIATILCLAGVGFAWPYFSDKSELSRRLIRVAHFDLARKFSINLGQRLRYDTKQSRGRANTIGPTPDAYNGINKGGGHVYSSVGSTAVRKIQAYKRRSMGTYQ